MNTKKHAQPPVTAMQNENYVWDKEHKLALADTITFYEDADFFSDSVLYPPMCNLDDCCKGCPFREEPNTYPGCTLLFGLQEDDLLAFAQLSRENKKKSRIRKKILHTLYDARPAEMKAFGW